MQWLKLPAWKVGDRGFEPHFGLQVSKKQNVSSPLTRKNSILWGTSGGSAALSALHGNIRVCFFSHLKL